MSGTLDAEEVLVRMNAGGQCFPFFVPIITLEHHHIIVSL